MGTAKGRSSIRKNSTSNLEKDEIYRLSYELLKKINSIQFEQLPVLVDEILQSLVLLTMSEGVFIKLLPEFHFHLSDKFISVSGEDKQQTILSSLDICLNDISNHLSHEDFITIDSRIGNGKASKGNSIVLPGLDDKSVLITKLIIDGKVIGLLGCISVVTSDEMMIRRKDSLNVYSNLLSIAINNFEANTSLSLRINLESAISDIISGFINVKYHDIDSTINRALEKIGYLTGRERVYVMLFEEREVKLNNYEYTLPGFENKIKDLEHIPVTILTWWMEEVRQKKIFNISIDDSHPDSNEHHLLKSRKISSLLSVPLSHDGEFLGLLGLDSINNVKNWTNEDITLLKTIADTISHALHWKNTEQFLQESDDRLRKVLEITSDGVWDFNIKTGSLYLSSNWFKMLGYEIPKEINYNLWSDNLHPEDKESTLKNLDDHIKGKSKFYRSEFRMRSSGNRWKWILSRGKVIEFDSEGNPLRILGTHEDISDQKFAEQGLKESEEKYKQLFFDAPTGIYQTSLDGHFINLNQTMASMLGYNDPMEVLEENPNIGDLLYKDRGLRETIIQNALEQNVFYRHNLIFHTKDGKPFNATLSIKPVRDTDGNPMYFIGHVEDTTERRLTEIALIQSERKLRNIIEQSNDGIILVGSNGEILEWNLSMEEITGLLKSDVYEKSIWDVRYLMEPINRRSELNRETFRNSVIQALDSGTGNFFNRLIEYDINTPQGFTKVIQELNFSISSDDGIQIASVIRDITEKKLTDEALRDSEERYRLLADNSTDMISRYNADGKLIYISPAVYSMTGFSTDELLYHSANELVLEEDVQKFIEANNEARLSGLPVSITFRIQNKSGSVKWVESKIKAISNYQSSQTDDLIAVTRDITETKIAELKLKDSEEKYRNLFELESDALFLISTQDNAIIEVNESACILYGYSREEFFNLNKDDLLFYSNEKFAIGELGQDYPLIQYHKKKNGDIFPVEIMARETSLKSTDYMVAAVRDISIRIETQNELEKQKEFLRKVIDSNPSYIYVKDRTGELVLQNQSWEFMSLRLSTHEVSPVSNLNKEGILNKLDKEIFKNQKSATVENVEITLSNGLKKWLSVNKIALKNPEGMTIYVITVATDITNIKLIEEELRESNKIYRLLEDNATDIITRQTYDGILLYISPASIPVLFYHPDELINTNIFDLVHPDDIDNVLKVHNDLLRIEKTNITRYRIKNRSGSYIWVESSHKSIKDPYSQDIIEIVSVTRDITQRKDIEDELERSFSIVNSAIESTADGMVILDNDDKLMIYNSKFENIWGLPKAWNEEFSYQKLVDSIVSKLEDSRHYRKVFKNISLDNFNEHYENLELKDGRIIEFYISPMTVSNERVGRVWNFRDLTERKSAERALHETFIKLKALITAIPDQLYFKDASQRIVIVNKAYLDWFGMDEDDVIGKTDFEIFNHEEALVNSQIETDVVQSGSAYHQVEKLMNRENRQTYFESMKFPIIDERGNVEGLLGIKRDITEQRRAVNAIRESEEKFRRIFETAIEGIILISADGKSYAMNKTMNDLIKLPAGTQEIEIKDYIHEDWQDKHQDKIEQIKTGKPYQSDFCYIKTDGTILWVSESSVGIFDNDGIYNGYLSMIADISDRVKAHTKIIKQRDLFESVSRASNILITKKDYYIGIYESMEILGESALIDCISIFQRDIISESDPNNFIRIYEWQSSTSNYDSNIHNLIPNLINRPDSLSAQTLQSGEPFIMHNIIDILPENQSNDFSNLSSSILLIPIHMREQFWGFIEYRFPNLDYDWFEDIKAILSAFTSSIGSAIEQKINADNLKEAKITAEEANRSKSEFLANMSHEIRTPLTAVIGFSELLMNRITDKQHLKFLNTILNSSNSLLALINDILDLSKIEAGKLEIQPKAINAKRILLEIEQIFSQKIHEKNLAFLLEIDENIPEFLILDEVRFRQILFNLVGNAVKFTENGFIKIKLIPTNFSYTKTDLIITVEDTGIGISKELQESIFDAFSQQSSHTARKYGGTGLGLAITKRLAEKMNGTISLKSEPGNGSSFRIVIRDIIVADEAKKPETNKYPSVSDYKFVNSRILLVDDFEYNRELIKYYLNGSNIEITESITGEDALYLAKIILPDLILMDVKLPGMDGNIVAQKLKEDPDFDDIPIIAFTASTISEEGGEFFEHFDGYIRKPINSTNLYNELKRFLPVMDPTTKTESELFEDFPDLDNEIDEMDNEKRQKLTLILQSNILPRVRNLSEVLIIDDIDQLFREINDVNSEFNIRTIDKYISVMSETLQSYDVKKIKKVLNDFYDFLLILIGNEDIE